MVNSQLPAKSPPHSSIIVAAMDSSSPPSLKKNSSAPSAVVRNPYLNSRRKAPTAGDAAALSEDAQQEGEEAKPEVEQPEWKDESIAEEKKDDGNVTRTSTSTSNPPPPASSSTFSSNNAPAPNTGLAYWERLPSKNLSQRSAEILTVDECVKHSALYRGKAVRVTGQLHQRAFVGDDVETPRQVLLELIDPTAIMTQAAKDTPAKTTTTTTTTPPSSMATANTPGKSSSTTTTTTTTPGSTFKTPFKTPLKTTLGPARRPASGGGPLLGGSSNNYSSTKRTPGSSSSSSSTLLSNNKRKRPWFPTSSARKKTPPKAAPRLLLKVLVDPELPRLDTIAPSGASKVMVLGVILESGWMKAGFVSLVNPSTDMSLYVVAIQARRRYLYQRYKQELLRGDATMGTTPTNNNNDGRDENGESSSPPSSSMEVQATGTVDDSNSLLLGCGPPPYDHLQK